MKMSKPAAVIAFAAALASCNQNGDAAKTTEGYETSRNGLEYKLVRDEKTTNASLGDYVKFSTTLRTLNGDLVFSTNASNEFVYSQVGQPRYKGDPLEILQMVSKGDSVSVIIPEKEFFRGQQLPPTVKPGDNVRMDLAVYEVYNKEQYETTVLPEMNNKRYAAENKQLDDYIAAQGWNAMTLPSGLRLVVDSKGSGTEVSDGAQVKVNYTGKLLNGTVFDSNVLPEFNHVQPFELTVGKGMVIKGWDEGLKNFNKGGKGKLIIPARLGYGEQGTGKIPPNAPLVFEVEILDVQPGA